MNKKTTTMEQKKNYSVYVDITVSNTIYVEAESEAKAKEIVSDMMRNNPYGHCNYNAVVAWEIVDVNEDEE